MQNGIQSDRRTLARQRKVRKQRFAAALALAGLRQSDFADRNDVDPGHLSKVLNGDRESASLTEKVDAFIAKYLPSSEAA